jgi:hypothetical protein
MRGASELYGGVGGRWNRHIIVNSGMSGVFVNENRSGWWHIVVLVGEEDRAVQRYHVGQYEKWLWRHGFEVSSSG